MNVKKDIMAFRQTGFINVGDNRYEIADITFDQVRLMYGTGRGYHISGSGRDKVTGYRHGVMTKLGDVEESEWDELLKFLIERDGEQQLFKNLLEWETEHNYCESDKKTLEHDTLVSHSHRIFDNPKWVDFVRFNQKYRPEVLAKATLVDIVTDCCGAPDLQTVELVDEWSKVTCPKCGTYTTFKKKEGIST